MTNFEKVGLFMKTFGQEVKVKASFSSDKINKFVQQNIESIHPLSITNENVLSLK